MSSKHAALRSPHLLASPSRLSGGYIFGGNYSVTGVLVKGREGVLHASNRVVTGVMKSEIGSEEL